MKRRPVLALVGRPNVGKSTLFNVFTHSRNALVANIPGVTRDRQYGRGMLDDRGFVIIDTGGIADEDQVSELITQQVESALHEADLILFVVDGRAGINAGDHEIAERLRRHHKPVMVVVNKTDGLDEQVVSADFYQLGFAEVLPVAASHRRGTLGLLTHALDRCDEVFAAFTKDAADRRDDEEDDIESDWCDDSDEDLEDENLEGQDPGDDDFDEDDFEQDDFEQDQDLHSNQGDHEEDFDDDIDPLDRAHRPHIRFAIIGRPNVGKSTLTNRILGEPRVLTMDLPGTTTDSVYIPFERHGEAYVIVDTAGVRRKGRVEGIVEKFSVVKTLDAIDRVDVVVLLIDGQEGLTEQDMHLMGYALEAGRALVIGVNKWDGLSDEQRRQVKEAVSRKLSFLSDFVEIFYISAEHGTAVGDLFPAIRRAYESSKLQVSSSHLTQILEDAVAEHAPPLIGGRRVKLRYAHMGGQYPPVIVIHGSQVEQLGEDYRRYLVNQFRDVFQLVGSPIRVEFRNTENPYAGKKNLLTPRQEYQRRRMMTHIKKTEKSRKDKKNKR